MYSNPRSLSLAILCFVSACGVRILAQDQTINGNLVVSGSIGAGGAIDSDNNTLSFGTQSGAFAAALIHQDSNTDTFTFLSNRSPASWLWQHTVAVAAMRLDSNHQLILYKADGTTTGVTLTPASSAIKLGTHANGTLTADANGGITAGGAFVVAGGITNTNGTLTGGASGLTLAAGGMDQNITLNPSGAGRVSILSTVASTSPTTGALTVAGGLGVAGRGNFGGDISVFGTNASRAVIISTTTAGAATYVAEGFSASDDYAAGYAGARLRLWNKDAALNNFSAVDGVNSANSLVNRIALSNPSGNNGRISFLVASSGSLVERMRIGSNGNVGIGITGPQSLLHVNGTMGIGTSTDYWRLSRTGANLDMSVIGTSANYAVNILNPDAVGQAGLTVEGKLGVGTSSPTYKLHVVDTATSGGVISRWTRNSKSLEFYSGSTVDLMMGTPGNHSLGLYTNNSDPLITLTAAQQVGIGTTNPGFVVGSGLEIERSNASATLRLQRAGDGTSAEFAAGSAQLYIGVDAENTVANSNINFAIDGLDRLRIESSGNVGIGTTAPGRKLTAVVTSTDGVNGTVANSYPIAEFINHSSGNALRGLEIGAPTGNVTSPVYLKVSGTSSRLAFLNEGNVETLSILTNGNVGVGTASPTHKLAVKGTIRAEEVIVDTGWADYVFEDDYRLAPLTEVEQHIREKKHLPGIPSAAEVAEHGVSMGDMQVKMMAKIEELTLHLIAQEKELAALRSEVTQLKTAAARP